MEFVQREAKEKQGEISAKEGRVLANRRLLRGKSPGTARKLRESGAREQIPDSQGQLSVCASG